MKKQKKKIHCFLRIINRRLLATTIKRSFLFFSSQKKKTKSGQVKVHDNMNTGQKPGICLIPAFHSHTIINNSKNHHHYYHRRCVVRGRHCRDKPTHEINKNFHTHTNTNTQLLYTRLIIFHTIRM